MVLHIGFKLTGGYILKNHEIDYEIYGSDTQYIEIELDPSEAVLAEAGSMMMMEDGVEVETIFGDGSEQDKGGIFNKLKNAGKRVITGESLFMTVYSNESSNLKKVAFSAPYPGQIIPLNLAELGGKMITQKDAFLAAAKGVSVGIEFQKKLGAGFMGGEGFIMQKLEGDGMAFIHAGGSIYERELKRGEKLKVDTGCLVAMTQDVDYDIEFVKGIKSMAFGGEGMFYATVQGPGTVLLQSMPFSRLSDRIYSNSPAGISSKGEGSILGGAFDLLGGD